MYHINIGFEVRNNELFAYDMDSDIPALPVKFELGRDGLEVICKDEEFREMVWEEAASSPIVTAWMRSNGHNV